MKPWNKYLILVARTKGNLIEHFLSHYIIYKLNLFIFLWLVLTSVCFAKIQNSLLTLHPINKFKDYLWSNNFYLYIFFTFCRNMTPSSDWYWTSLTSTQTPQPTKPSSHKQNHHYQQNNNKHEVTNMTWDSWVWLFLLSPSGTSTVCLIILSVVLEGVSWVKWRISFQVQFDLWRQKKWITKITHHALNTGWLQAGEPICDDRKWCVFSYVALMALPRFLIRPLRDPLLVRW